MHNLRRRYTIHGSLTIGAISLFSGVADAQQSAKKPPISLNAEVRHDSNVSRASATQSSTRGLQRADERFVPSVELNVAKRIGVFDATLVGSAGYVFYRQNTRLNRERIGLEGTVLANLSRCRVNLALGVRRAQSDLADIAFVTDTIGGEVVRNVENTFHYGAEANCGSTIGFRPTVAIQRETGANSNVRRQFSDFNRTNYIAGVAYTRPVFGTLTLFGSIEETSYPNRPRIGNITDGYTSYSATAKFERRIGGNLQGTVQVGYNNLNPRRPGVPGFSGIVGSADLTATFADRLQIGLQYTRDTSPTLQSDAVYRVGDSYGLTSTLAVSQRLSATAGLSYRTRRLVGAGTLPTTSVLTGDERLSATGGLSWRFNSRLRLALDVVYDRRTAAEIVYDSDNFGIGLSAKLAI